ncbi:MAG: S-layer homology domain-containing protein [Clostridia bacterium]|nr:S-layer homology domain-containing protein [Clostridia bacterium]
MKRFFASLLILTMMFSMITVASFAEEVIVEDQEIVEEKTNVAAIGDTEYETLAMAVEEAEANAVIKLIDDIELTEMITIAEDDVITLDLNGKVLSGVSSEAKASAVITNKGSLTIKDLSEDKKGKITSKALQPDKVAIPGYANNTITNAGTLVVDSGTIENTTEKGGACYAIDSAWSQKPVSVTVNGGKVICENNVAIRQAVWTNAGYNVEINDGEVTGVRAVWIQLPGSNDEEKTANLTVKGGTLTSSDETYYLGIYSYSFGDSYEGVNIEITDGTINGYVAVGGGSANGGTGAETVTVTGGAMTEVFSYNSVDNISVTGGKFTYAPSDYIAKGRVVSSIDEENYKFEVVEIQNPANAGLTVAPIKPEITTGGDAPQEVVDAIAGADYAPTVDGITDIVKEVAETANLNAETAKAELENILEVSLTEEDVKFFVQPSVEIKVVDAETEVEDDEEKYTSITFDIEVFVQVIASTADKHSDIELSGDNQNAVVVGSQEIEDEVVISIPVGEDLAAKLPYEIMIKHTKEDDGIYYYPAKLENGVITFTNPHGFSVFTVEAARSVTIKFEDNEGKAAKTRGGETIADITDLEVDDLEGEIVLPDAYKKSNKFNGWRFESNGDLYNDKITLTPEIWDLAVDGVLTATASFTKIASGSVGGIGGSSSGDGLFVTYTVKYDSMGGTAVKSETVAKGDVITEPAAPTNGDREFEGWYTDAAFNSKYDFSEPVYSSFTLYAKWAEEEAAATFTDVTEADWFFDAVNQAFELGLMNGMGDGIFAPNEKVTRGMFTTILYRIAGEPETAANAVFTDVAAETYYANAIAWASENGIVNGMTEAEFSPDSPITREQMATILFRYAEKTGKDVLVAEGANTLSFTDGEDITEYAVSAIDWACAVGLMQGYPDGTFMPQNTATRAEAATVFIRGLDLIK